MKTMILLTIFSLIKASHNSTADQELYNEIRREREVTDRMLRERVRVVDRQLIKLHERMAPENCTESCPLWVLHISEMVQSDRKELVRTINKINDVR